MPLDALISGALRVCGLAKRARANYLSPRIVERPWRIPRLPRAFAGFRLLQLSDLHPVADAGTVIAALHQPRFGILGNHDFIEQVSELETLGLPVLLNEVASIARGTDLL